MNKIQQKAKQLGHCLCSKEFTCPCEYYKNTSKCHCAGDIIDIGFETWIEYNK